MEETLSILSIFLISFFNIFDISSLGLAPSSWGGGNTLNTFNILNFIFSIFLIVPVWDELHHPGVEEYFKSCQERDRIGYFLDKQFNFLLHITDFLFKEVDVVNESINLYYN